MSHPDIKLFNTMGRQLENFKPLKADSVKLYTCGPTVYNYAHIGNLRAYVFDDLLRRTLELAGYDVDHVMNITDVGHLVSDADEGEDKLQTGAQREGKTVWEVAKFFTEAFLKDIDRLNIERPKRLERATDHIEEQVKLVQILLDKGFAYQTKQAIYYDITKFKDYGRLSGQALDEKETAARPEVVTDPHKHHPQDFALWFFTVGHFADHEMRWPTPWGEGFPGWHLECSAIIQATLGDTIDIHTGGVDHIGTHHSNEIAQSQAATGHPLAQVWLHNEFMLVDGSKMAKSAGNFYTLPELEAKGFSPLAFRLLCLQAHYRSELNFTWYSLRAAQNFLKRLRAWADLRHQPETDTMPEELDRLWQTTRQAMHSALFDDLNSPQALAALTRLTDYMVKHPVPAKDGQYSGGALEEIDQMLGLGLAARPDVSDDIKQLIKQRETARTNKDFAKSDQLRQQLSKQGIELDDAKFGPRWRRSDA